MKLKVIIFGASGMVGEGILIETLKKENVDSVLVIGRRSCGIVHKKLKEIIHTDFFNYSKIEAQLTGYNTCFFCLGVSSVGMNEQNYKHITYDLTMQTASTLAKLNPEMTFCYISGTGTDSTEQGRLMWARVKGKTENDLFKIPFKSVFSFRPGLMKPSQSQRNVKLIYSMVGSLFPLWKILIPKFVCTLEELGSAMLYVAEFGYPKRVLEIIDILAAAKSFKQQKVSG
jgi:hypothetical protein